MKPSKLFIFGNAFKPTRYTHVITNCTALTIPCQRFQDRKRLKCPNHPFLKKSTVCTISDKCFIITSSNVSIVEQSIHFTISWKYQTRSFRSLYRFRWTHYQIYNDAPMKKIIFYVDPSLSATAKMTLLCKILNITKTQKRKIWRENWTRLNSWNKTIS